MSERILVTVNDGVSELVVFIRADGSAQAVVLRDKWADATRIEIDKPPQDYQIAMVTLPGGAKAVAYRRVE